MKAAARAMKERKEWQFFSQHDAMRLKRLSLSLPTACSMRARSLPRALANLFGLLLAFFSLDKVSRRNHRLGQQVDHAIDRTGHSMRRGIDREMMTLPARTRSRRRVGAILALRHLQLLLLLCAALFATAAGGASSRDGSAAIGEPGALKEGFAQIVGARFLDVDGNIRRLGDENGADPAARGVTRMARGGLERTQDIHPGKRSVGVFQHNKTVIGSLGKFYFSGTANTCFYRSLVDRGQEAGVGCGCPFAKPMITKSGCDAKRISRADNRPVRMCAVDACEVRTEVKKSGLVREDGEVRPADFAGDLMAEAIDGAVEFIVSLMEDRKLRRMKTDPDRNCRGGGSGGRPAMRCSPQTVSRGGAAIGRRRGRPCGQAQAETGSSGRTQKQGGGIEAAGSPAGAVLIVKSETAEPGNPRIDRKTVCKVGIVCLLLHFRAER